MRASLQSTFGLPSVRSLGSDRRQLPVNTNMLCLPLEINLPSLIVALRQCFGCNIDLSLWRHKKNRWHQVACILWEQRSEVLMAAGTKQASKILLIDSDQATSDAVITALRSSQFAHFEIATIQRLSDSDDYLKENDLAAIFLNLFLKDSEGIETFTKLHQAAPGVPVLIIGQEIHENLAVEAVEQGAQDYLLPGHLDSYSLPRALRNAIDRTAVEDALYVERERALVTLNSIGDAVLCTDVAGCITYMNVVAERITGWSREEAGGKYLVEVFRILDGVTREPARDPMAMAVAENRTVGLTPNCILIRRDGEEFAIEDSAAPIHDRTGAITGAVIVFHDVSVARAMSIEMNHSAHYDAVTKLPNRLLLDDRITQATASSHRTGKSFAVMFLDLDHFKAINDALGHSMGDRLLQEVGTRLTGYLRETDTISRHGGDEFVLLLPDVLDTEAATTSANRLLFALGQPFVIGEHTLHINGSLGISFYPQDGDNANTLIRNADLAMYQAKEEGRNNFRFFEARMNLAAIERQRVETGIRRALDRNEFELYYQPKINLEDGRIVGAEALIRWRDPVNGLVLPAQFIPVAEMSGLIVPLGRWVMREACRQARNWQDQGLSSLTVAVNVSAIEFRQENFPDEVEKTLNETGLTPDWLQLELTEAVLMKDAASTTVSLQALKRLGVKLAIDDFGTGYSSLSYLRQFPIDVLKIDKSFTHHITKDPETSVLIGAIIAIGRSLKHTVVAEGIETQEQKDYLLAARCPEGQGYFFSYPLPAVDFARLMPCR
jgi:diguanylate cyclase (GGDEF)-like protein/PAS domain S-box-containing protein